MRAVILSVAHSWRAYGAYNQKHGLKEYDISLRATDAAATVLRQHDCPIGIVDAGDNGAKEYARIKTEVINAVNPSLAVEIHCNASQDSTANYGEVIHHPLSPFGARAAAAVSQRLEDAFKQAHHAWPWHGARPWKPQFDQHQFFFLSRTNCPSIIVEGLFLSNDEQAAWLKDGGAEAYGALVGEGIAQFLEAEQL